LTHTPADRDDYFLRPSDLYSFYNFENLSMGTKHKRENTAKPKRLDPSAALPSVEIRNPMQHSTTEPHRWAEQCTAAKHIKERFGVEAALEYVVGEKLLVFVGLAERDPESATALPRFAAQIKQLFTDAELGEYLDRLPRHPRLRPAREHAGELGRYACVRQLLEC
jgi:hypothetical protein